MGISLRPSDAIQDLESAQIEIQLLQREIKQLRRELHFIYGWPWKFAFSTLPFGRSRAEMKLNHEYLGDNQLYPSCGEYSRAPNIWKPWSWMK